ncbi:AfsR/SARP family transcriptional regulator [Micromonospora okii]|uniref:AfsR/SARP family transcriptional regulator n=1 Tax=Micromonospora okii TaxID=1182970 RepID=UPI001E5EB838|nr:AfsR/SARP family transcriptional regulator [Micromonospora okii]
MRCAILGTLAVEAADGPVPLRGGRVSVLLATLLLDANRTVSTDRLIESLWSLSPPATARSQLTIVVSQLRRLLAGARADAPAVVTEGVGYRACVSATDLDALVFDRLAAEGDRAVADGRPEDAVDRFRAALALWRGPALPGLDSPVVRAAAELLTRRRTALRARCAELDLTLGRHASVVTELSELVADEPLDERLSASLMTALYRLGRAAEALDVFHGIRCKLADELGIEPGRQLTELHRRILNRDPALDAPAPPARPSRPTRGPCPGCPGGRGTRRWSPPGYR